ncbi:MAG: phospho-N-acetylmuramoyl-pentapeptide-transferase [Synergistaceae bacterium]|jgi:phospho-N-acetylmuramoyl-pentapeptide-transferase|nr:phospho-N-acetylmuramoyl-pentapeptide-transferase [Synergistaceae bacterium]
MPLKILCLSLAFFAAALYCQRLWITWMRRYGLGEAIKEYGPQSHIKKRGTPSMGGVVALVLVPIIVLSAKAAGLSGLKEMACIWIYPVLGAFVGLLDDLLKKLRKSSEGLKSLQKLAFQIAVTAPWAWWAARGGVYLTPEFALAPFHGAASLLFIGVGLLNAVNVTDGLDGLAGSIVAISLSALLISSSFVPARLSAAAGLAIVSAFLWHNSNPAELFMGDVGAHLWAGLLLALCLESRFLLLVFPVGFLFGVEIATVAIQITAIKKFGRKVFLMSPLHHHFELCGWKEPKIVSRFCLAHLVGMAALFIFVLALCGGGVSNVRP